MSNPDYSPLVTRRREYFLSGATRPPSWRKAQLTAVKALFTENHDELCDPGVRYQPYTKHTLERRITSALTP